MGTPAVAELRRGATRVQSFTERYSSQLKNNYPTEM